MAASFLAETPEGLPIATLPPTWSMYTTRQRWGFLAVLFLVSTSQFLDRSVISVLLEPIKQEFKVSDTMLGFLGGTCFALVYAVAGMPVARWADRGNRRTVITLSLVVWSVMTLFCGLAQTFWQLALARVGVGMGESGGIPASQSLIADYFPPERRATAIAIFVSAVTAGNVLGLGVGGNIAATHGWRQAFLLAAWPGLLLALVVRLTLAEPRLQAGGGDTAAQAERAADAISRLRQKRSYVTALFGSVLYYLFVYGPVIFIPSFLLRVLHEPLARASTTLAVVGATASLIGTPIGGWLADRLSRRDIRWLGWLPALAFAVAGPVWMLAFSLNSTRVVMACIFIATVVLAAGFPSVFSAIHSVCGSARRATAIAIVLFSASLLGGGFGPLASGALSDALSVAYGREGLRYALMAMTMLLPASALMFYLCGRALPRDLDR
jgi:predicted MFS family arabinose efflux permease